MKSASDASSAIEQTAKAPTAAEKVFSIGELVENILIYLPDTAVEQQSAPFFQLFELQSLNSTTKITINSSKALRQHMFLEPQDSTSPAARTPMIWLLRQLGIHDYTASTKHYDFLHIISHGPHGTFTCKVHGYLRDCIAAFS